MGIITWVGTEPGHWSKISPLFGFPSAIKSSQIRTLVFCCAWKGSVLPERWHCWWAALEPTVSKCFPVGFCPCHFQIYLALRDVQNGFFWTGNCWFCSEPQFSKCKTQNIMSSTSVSAWRAGVQIHWRQEELIQHSCWVPLIHIFNTNTTLELIQALM